MAPTPARSFISVWRLEWAGPGRCDSYYIMLAHVLLTPIRLIVLPLDEVPRTPDGSFAVLKFRREASSSLLAFDLLYEWLHDLQLSWASDHTLSLFRHDFLVVDWDVLLLEDPPSPMNVCTFLLVSNMCFPFRYVCSSTSPRLCAPRMSIAYQWWRYIVNRPLLASVR